jgi:alkylation response protein AidB-like acyl-CoA dehydrogenase
MASTAPPDAAALVRAQLDRLLAEHDPRTTEPATFWGAQYDLGLAWVHFPEGRGGLGVDPDLQLEVDDALHAAGAPTNLLINFMGVGMAAPTILAHGTDAMRDHHLRRIFTCEDVWCQLFSEPGAGSDLAALATAAVRDGDGWVLNGQKVWTTQAHVARHGLILARTDPEQPKHRGLTYFVLDMAAPGVEVRPLRQLTGDAEFNEVYLTDVRIPDDQRIGEVGDGWRVAITTLMNERAALSGFGRQPRGSGAIGDLVRIWAEHGRDRPQLRDEVARVWIEAEVLRLTTVRAQQLRKAGTPGPEGAVGKLAMSLLQQRAFDVLMDVRGAESLLIEDYAMRRPTLMSEGVLGSGADRDLTKAFLTTRGSTIGGGTTEVGRTILAERVLGLPGDLRTDKDVPWSQVPRS